MIRRRSLRSTGLFGTSLRFSSSSTTKQQTKHRTSNEDDDIVSILNDTIPSSSTSTATRIKQGNIAPSSSSSTAATRFLSDFSILHPKTKPKSLPYLCPPKWIHFVADTVESHFHYQIAPSSISNAGETKTNSISKKDEKKKAPRPELFVQSFVHPSFLRDYEKRKFQQQQQEEQQRDPERQHYSNEDELGSDGIDIQDEDMDTASMASLAEVGSAVLQYAVTAVLSPLLPDLVEVEKFVTSSNKKQHPQQQSDDEEDIDGTQANDNEGGDDDNKWDQMYGNPRRQRQGKTAPSSPNNPEAAIDFAVFPLGGDFFGDHLLSSSSCSSSSSSSSASAASKKQRLSMAHFNNFAVKTFASPQAAMKNNQTLASAISSNHNLSLICFNVWKVSDLVLTDAGIYGLRDALRSSSKDKLKVPPLPMPAAAMNVRAVVGAVYLNFGLEEAVKFCQIHVVSHAVTMMPKQ